LNTVFILKLLWTVSNFHAESFMKLGTQNGNEYIYSI